MAVRLRVQLVLALLASGLLAALFTGIPSSAEAAVSVSHQAAPLTHAPAAARKAAPSAGSVAGAKAGRKAGAAAGAKAGRAAGGRAGSKAALAGEKAGRTAGAAAGAKAGATAGTKHSKKAGTKAGTKAGKKAGAKAGAVAGKRVADSASLTCGTVTYRKPDGTPWKCAFGDDFDGTRLDSSKWQILTSAINFGKRLDCFVDSPQNISVGGGVLKLTARHERKPISCYRGRTPFETEYSAGMVSTYQRYDQAYGRFEFRAKLPYTTARGLQTSMWLWPTGENGATWPASGEIDVAEWYSQYPDRVIPYVHFASGFLMPGQVTNTSCLVDKVEAWHTYLLEWTPDQIKISFDGNVCLVNTAARGSSFDRPYIISMFHGFGLKGNAPRADTPAVSTAQFAWVRSWS